MRSECNEECEEIFNISEDVSSVNYSKSRFYMRILANKRHKDKGRFDSKTSSLCAYFPIKGREIP